MNDIELYSADLCQFFNSLSSLKDTEFHVYQLTHSYDIPDSKEFYYFIAPYTENTMNAIIAFLQFEAAAIDIPYELSHQELLHLLSQFYDCVISPYPAAFATVIDVYVNWSTWEGIKLQQVSLFHREGLTQLLERIVRKT